MPLVTKDMVHSFLGRAPETGASPADLTTRQREVLQLIAEGHSAKEMAAILNVSVKTVEFHKASLMRQSGLRGTAELTKYAVQHGIVEL